MIANIESIWLSLSERLHAFIMAKVHDKSLADDLLQEVFIKVHTHINHLKDEDRIQGWIFSIARNIVLDHFRKTQPMAAITDLNELIEPADQSELMAEALQDMAMMMENMPAEFCDVLCKSELGGLSLQEYALETGISYSLARTRAHRARKMLKDLLMNCCHYQFDVYGTILDIQSVENCCCCCSDGESGS